MINLNRNMQDFIKIRGAREHNLKNISLEIPRNQLVVFSGLSGSGKSSLAFDTIFAEGQRRYVESLSAYARQFLGQMDKPDVDEITGLSPAISIDQKAHSQNPRSTVATITEIYDYLRVLFARVGLARCPICKRNIKKMTTEEIVSLVLREIKKIHSAKNHPVTLKDHLTIFAPKVSGRKGEYYQLLYDLLNNGFVEARVDGKLHSLHEQINLSRYKTHSIEVLIDRVPLAWPMENNDKFRAHLADSIELALKESGGLITIMYENGEESTYATAFVCPNDGFSFREIEPRLFSFNSPYGACEACHGLGTESLFSEKECPACHGRRLRDESLYVFVGGKNIVDIVEFGIREAYEFFGKIKDDFSEREKTISAPLLKEIQNRLKFMLDVGLHYLTLSRKAGTLSGGEAQRIRLASQIGSGLVGALYVLDEPTIGLHQQDNERLIATLEHLRDLGNSIIVVEHDEDVLRRADFLVDLGPLAGKAGGEITAIGPMNELIANKKSFQQSHTLAYLRGERHISVPTARRKNSKEKIKLIGVSENNLKNISVEIPLKRFVAVTGVSGSGKSTLVYDILWRALDSALIGQKEQSGKYKKIELYNHTGTKAAELAGGERPEPHFDRNGVIDKIIDIDQSAIGRTPRSNPATYIGVWTHIRDLFASTKEARTKGFTASRFSFNVNADPSEERGGGRCEQCLGHGLLEIEMHFLPTVYVVCDVCGGKRFDKETLDVQYKGKNIYEVLKMTVDEADKFFRDIPAIHDKLKVLVEVGLGYLELGQSATTLSGGEAQRVKLAAELARRATGRTLFVLDEPTVGLHFEDVKRLLDVLNRLVAAGNSLVVIEHNLDVIKYADYVIDLGPDGGNAGGEVVAAGTPEEVVRVKGSATGKYLRKVLK